MSAKNSPAAKAARRAERAQLVTPPAVCRQGDCTCCERKLRPVDLDHGLCARCWAKVRIWDFALLLQDVKVAIRTKALDAPGGDRLDEAAIEAIALEGLAQVAALGDTPGGWDILGDYIDPA